MAVMSTKQFNVEALSKLSNEQLMEIYSDKTKPTISQVCKLLGRKLERCETAKEVEQLSETSTKKSKKK